MSKLDHALDAARQGFLVFPISPNAKAPPLIKDWPTLATCDETQIKQWWWHYPEANIGIHCKGMIVADIDVKKQGNESFKFLEDTYGFPATRTHTTPTGGRHVFFSAAERAANSVSVLGPGLDIRSDSGYVVGPGSTIDSKSYGVADSSDIAPAPEWLVAKLATGKPHVPSRHVEVVDDASDDVVERAAEWLSKAERSVKGAGGDQAAYRVACGLRDFGVSYAQACELMRSDAWDLGCGWRQGKLEDKPIASAYRYAENEPGSKAAIASDFPEAVAEAAAVIVASSIADLGEFASATSHHDYIVKNLLYRGAYAEVYGPPGEGKTFVALDLGFHVAAEKPWMNRLVHGGPVLYLAYEGAGGLRKRAKALVQHYGQSRVPLFIHGASFNLRELKGRKELAVLMAKLPAKPALIVIDTFAHALCGGDENSAQDVSAFNRAAQGLIEHTGGCVLVVHHSGKDVSRGARGSSAILGAMDTVIEVADKRVIAKKQRDVDLGDSIAFKLHPICVGTDSDGDEVFSCVVMPDKAAASTKRMTPRERRAFEWLCDARPNNEPIGTEAWLDGCKEFGLGRTAFYDVRKQLVKKGLIEFENKLVTRRLQ